MRAFLFYVDDWLSSKRIEKMDAYEERGYLRLCLAAATDPTCSLPDNDAELAILSKLDGQWGKPSKEKVRRIGSKTSGEKLRECFSFRPEGCVDGRLYNERLYREWKHQRDVNDKRKVVGALGGRPKKNNQTVYPDKPNGKANGKQTETNDVCVCVSSFVSQEVKLKPETKINYARAESFAVFWSRWCELTHRKQRESDACRAWISCVTEETIRLAMDCLERYGRSIEVSRGVVTNADKWIYEQSRDNWEGDWQPPPTPHLSAKSKSRKVLQELIEEAEADERNKTDDGGGSEIYRTTVAHRAISARSGGRGTNGGGSDGSGSGCEFSRESDRRFAKNLYVLSERCSDFRDRAAA